MNIKHILFAASLPLCAFAQEQPTGVQVSGDATREIPNDRAGFTITLEGNGDSPKAAREALQVQAKKLDDLLSQFPGTEKTQTIDIRSTPIWLHRPNTPPQITGYSATITTATEIPAANAGDLAAQLLEINPHNLDGPHFHLSSALRKSKEIELLAQATKDAKEKAAALAEAAGMKMGNAVFLGTQTVWGGGPMDRMAMPTAMALGENGGAPEPMPAKAGEGTLSASVTGRFELLPKNQ